jgi:hypothetical protein
MQNLLSFSATVTFLPEGFVLGFWIFYGGVQIFVGPNFGVKFSSGSIISGDQKFLGAKKVGVKKNVGQQFSGVNI